MILPKTSGRNSSYRAGFGINPSNNFWFRVPSNFGRTLLIQILIQFEYLIVLDWQKFQTAQPIQRQKSKRIDIVERVSPLGPWLFQFPHMSQFLLCFQSTSCRMPWNTVQLYSTMLQHFKNIFRRQMTKWSILVECIRNCSNIADSCNPCNPRHLICLISQLNKQPEVGVIHSIPLQHVIK